MYKVKKYPVIADFKENNQVMKEKHLISFIYLPGIIIKNPLKKLKTSNIDIIYFKLCLDFYK